MRSSGLSTSLASPTAVTRVERIGLALAAVATGAVDMPLKEPSPVFGTAAQPGPNSPLAVELVLSVFFSLGAELEELESSEPHAAMPTDMVSARAARLVRLKVVLFMVMPFVRLKCIGVDRDSMPVPGWIGATGKLFS